MQKTEIHYKIFGIGKAGSQILAALKEKGLPAERLFYFDTDRLDFEKNTLNNKFLIGEGLLHGVGSGGKASSVTETFLQDKDLFDRLILDNCLYIVVGGLGRGTFSGFAPSIAGSLTREANNHRRQSMDITCSQECLAPAGVSGAPRAVVVSSDQRHKLGGKGYGDPLDVNFCRRRAPIS